MYVKNRRSLVVVVCIMIIACATSSFAGNKPKKIDFKQVNCIEPNDQRNKLNIKMGEFSDKRGYEKVYQKSASMKFSLDVTELIANAIAYGIEKEMMKKHVNVNFDKNNPIGGLLKTSLAGELKRGGYNIVDGKGDVLLRGEILDFKAEEKKKTHL